LGFRARETASKASGVRDVARVFLRPAVISSVIGFSAVR
jgi:hypothetical protein